MRKILSLLLLIVCAPIVQAASTKEFVSSLADAKTPEELLSSQEFLIVFVAFVLMFVIVVLGYLFYSLNALRTYIHPEKKESGFARFIKSMTDSVPVEHEADVMTDHVYDGIRELDNNLPPWWKYMFYLTILFSGVYIYLYHYSDNGLLQEEEYQQELVIAEKEKEEYMKKTANSIDETNVKVLSDAKTLDKGKSLYIQNCAPCHGKSGEGGVGPNLTDTYWLHGGGVKNVFKTIKYGVPEKGMISWKGQLSPVNIQDISNYIWSLQGSNPANGKAPQGDVYDGKNEVANK